MPTYKPTEGMKEEAQRGLDWRREYGRGGTEVGIARARDIVNDRNLSESTVKRMYSFFSRHEVDKDAEGFSQGEDGYPSNGRIAWALWGGDAGFTWSRNIVDSLDDDERAHQDETRPYPNEHAARLVDPAKFDDFRRETDAGGFGIDFIYGILGGKSEIQSIRFDADEYSEAEALAWLDEHDFTPIKFEPASIDERSSKDGVKSAKIGTNTKGMDKMKKRHVLNIEETEEAYIVTFAKPHAEDEPAAVEELPTEEERFSREDMSKRAMHMGDGEAAIDEQTRRVKVGVSSEEPVERSFGLEVIDHARESMNLDFLNSGRAPLLLDHDMEKQIGVIEGVELDEDARRLRAVVRFGKGPLASEVFNDVTDGIRQNISVGYRIDGRVKRDGDPDDYYRVAVTPMEISIVSVPADQSNLVGVGRSVPATPKSQSSLEDVTMTDKVENNIDLDAVKAEAVRAARKNDAEILAIAAKHNKRDLANEAIAKGMSVDAFRGALLDAIGNKPLDVAPAAIDAPVKEKRNYSLGRMIQAQATGDWRKAGFEREINDEIAKRVGNEARGVYVPDFAWQQRGPLSTAATGGSGSEVVFDDFVPTAHRGDMFIEALRARQVLGGLGTTYMTGLTGRIKMPKLATGANAAFVEELAAVADGAGTDGGVTLQPRTMGAYVDMSRLLVMESVPAIEQIIQNDLLASAADRLEYYAIQGSGSGGQPTGILNTSGVNNLDISAGTDVDSLTWADIINLVKLVEEDNGIVNGNAAGFLSHPAVKAKLASTAKVASTDSVMIMNDPWTSIYGYPAAFSSNVPTTLDPGDGGNDASALIFGDFSQLIIAQFGAPSIMVDPYTNSTSGTVRMVLHTELDVGVRNAVSFGITDEVSVA